MFNETDGTVRIGGQGIFHVPVNPSATEPCRRDLRKGRWGRRTNKNCWGGYVMGADLHVHACAHAHTSLLGPP